MLARKGDLVVNLRYFRAFREIQNIDFSQWYIFVTYLVIILLR